MKKNNLLLVDDDEALLFPFRLMLEHAGYRVLTAQSGTEALHTLDIDDVDLMISDIDMPGMDGIELLGRVKADHRNTQVIMHSGGNYEVGELKMRGALDLIAKPTSPKQVVEKVNRIIAEEHRASSRFTVRLPVKTGPSQEGHALNISSDGMLVETPEPLPVEQQVPFTLFNPAVLDYFSVPGRVLKTTVLDNTCRSAVYFMRNIGFNLAGCMKNVLQAGYAS